MRSPLIAAGVVAASLPTCACMSGVLPGGGGGGKPVAVIPIEGPAPVLPLQAAPSSEGYAVKIEFTVDAAGKPSDLRVVDAGHGGAPVVAAALETVASSRFPTDARGSYRATHTVEFADAPLQPPGAGGRSGMAPIWERALSQADYEAVYPPRARERGIGGQAALTCRIEPAGSLTACAIDWEWPASWGFGDAALALARQMRAGARMSDGRPSTNQAVQIRLEFSPVR